MGRDLTAHGPEPEEVVTLANITVVVAALLRLSEVGRWGNNRGYRSLTV